MGCNVQIYVSMHKKYNNPYSNNEEIKNWRAELICLTSYNF